MRAKLNNVNTTDIREAIRLGCHTMSSIFNADDHDIPYQQSHVIPEALLAWTANHSESHVPGRDLNALLNARDAAGITIDEQAIEKHARAAFFSYSGPVPLPLNRQEKGGKLIRLVPHNIREGFHALYALAHFHNSTQARDLAQKSIQTIFNRWDPRHGWDRNHLEAELGLKVIKSTFIVGLGRSIGPLIKLYRTTGMEQALELALVLKDKAINEFFQEDGKYDSDLFGTHTHSTTSVMSSLAQLADLLHDSATMDRVRAFYDHGLWKIRDALGWVIEMSGDQANPDRGESNCTGDIVETAMILGRWGYTEYYEDAERILRCHLLPSQLRDISFIKEPDNPDNVDAKKDVAHRLLGSFGFPAPWGHEHLGAQRKGFHMDSVGSVVGSLCEVYRAMIRSDRAGHWVTLLFDHETQAVAVESPYTHPCLRVKVKQPGPLFVRIPSWVDLAKVKLHGTTQEPCHTNGYLFLPSPPRDQWISFDFPLDRRELVLQHQTRDVRTRLRGDEVVAMDNFGADLTFFNRIDQ